MSRRSALNGTDREAFIKAQIVSVHKALNKNEVPLKQKHVRVLIVGSHKEKSSSVFWNTVSRIQLEKNPIVSWKFCHLLHKLIRDGHPNVIDETNRYVQRIVHLGNFWQHLHTSGYGVANSAYCKLLVNRLAFLKRNRIFPGSLHLSEAQANTLVNVDVNQSYEVAIDMLDQMDDLLNLEEIVFESMGVVSWNSSTPQGQCLLAPLILVIVDASKFYDYLVKIIFRLHGQIPPDALAGHRERFETIFRKTKKFFEKASNLPYFTYLVSIPTLPDQAPNFLRASDLEAYQTPQAVLHSDDVSEIDTPPDGVSIADENLVDISEENTVSSQNQIDEKDTIIETLRRNLEDSRLNQARLMNEARSRIEQYENCIQQLKSEGDQYKQTVDELKGEIDKLKGDEARLQDTEKRAQSSEENFAKMKNAYADLRKEHIQALTKLSTAQKELGNSVTEKLNKEEALNNLEKELTEVKRERDLLKNAAEGAASSVDDLQSQLAKCQVDIESLNKTIEEINKNKAKEVGELTTKNAELMKNLTELESFKSSANEKLLSANKEADLMKLRLSEHVAEIEHLKKITNGLVEREKILNDLLNEANRHLCQKVEEKTSENDKLLQQLEEESKIKGNLMAQLQKKMKKNELDKFAEEKQQLLTALNSEKQLGKALQHENSKRVQEVDMLSEKLIALSMELDKEHSKAVDLNRKHQQVSMQLSQMRKTLETREQESDKKLKEAEKNYALNIQQLQSDLFGTTCMAIKEFLQHSQRELESATSMSYPIQLALSSIRSEIDMMKKWIPLVESDKPTPDLLHAVTFFNHIVADTVINTAAAAYTVSIQHYEPVHEQCRTVASDAIKVIEAFNHSKFKSAYLKEVPSLVNSLEHLEQLCLKLPASSADISFEKLGSMVEDEMKRMDEVIRNAVKSLEEMQKKSRKNDSGIRLEVNEKILDSCNALMAAIVQLVAKSRAMQEEIVSLGRGTASPNEFYKRNHQWTEGLLSAAKAVGVAANVLVQAADGAITGKGKFEHLIVASQEIAGSTAQLFVSSRVKADRDSKRLADLAVASKSVTTCTAKVVATVKSGQQTLSDSQILDFSHLSLHEAKKEEMESQVKVLELEAELVRERARFAELRKQHYHLASLVNTDDAAQVSK
uniref:Huntingtin-interacting protein 1 n=1 Tax=Syphacia muris TaxID=451379 RepID=A0A0N5A900_9BILA